MEVILTNGEVVKTLFDVSKNKLLPCKISVKLPVFNPKVTSRSINIYTRLLIKRYRSSNCYLVAYKKSADYEFTAPVGAVVILEYTTGSWKNVHHRYKEYFIVKESQERKHVFKDLEENADVEGVIKNLVPVNLSGFNRAEIEAEVYNTYNALLSQFDPVDILYYIWIKTMQHEDKIEERLKRLKELIEQKERELEELRKELERLMSVEAK